VLTIPGDEDINIARKRQMAAEEKNNEEKAKEGLDVNQGKEWPGDDPREAPPGTEWRGKPGSEPGSEEGNYYNPKTGESYRPDLKHGDPIGRHWDYRDPNGKWHRIYPDGHVEPK
jgi:hypothetical protein